MRRKGDGEEAGGRGEDDGVITQFSRDAIFGQTLKSVPRLARFD